jgi:hypothetical protein
MFACVPRLPAGSVTLVVRLAPSALDVFPLVDTVNCGSNLKFWQFAAWNGVETMAVAPSAAKTFPLIPILLQLVGLNWNPGRVIVAFTCWICNGIPSKIAGILYGPLLPS